MEEWIERELKYIPRMPNHVLRNLIDMGTKTGSTVFGGINPENTDIDIILPPSAVLPEISAYMVESSNDRYVDDNNKGGFRSFYIISRNNLIYNLLLFSDVVEYRAWRRTTFIMKKIYKTDLIIQKMMEKKPFRILLFERIKKEILIEN